MAAISTIIAGIGVAASIAGTGMGIYGSMQQAKAQKESIAAQREAERQRQIAMNLDATRKKREMIRQAQVATANAQATANNQGAGQSSGLPGSLGAISGQSGVSMLGVEQNREIGNNIFAANARSSAAQMDAADSMSMQSLASGVGSLGGALVKNAGAIDRVGTYYSSNRNVGTGTWRLY